MAAVMPMPCVISVSMREEHSTRASMVLIWLSSPRTRPQFVDEQSAAGERMDVTAESFFRGDAAGRSVRLREIAGVAQIGHDVAHSGGAQFIRLRRAIVREATGSPV